ncbi:membrane protein insertion efficiency factor YidD [Poriferisphaera corsica]|uniref:membrane protein insertion efficiency factor YidD n=1 Tax=Poriferisphaera corsica TaxID=2528020 RepID=UPI0011A6916C|nr:membrane protein insertion efficiency factor YidD [Poriferisphaera corsica]
MIAFLNNLLSRFLIFLVMIYRYTLSPVMGRHCRYQPTCSQYMIDAIKKYGPYRGTYRGIKRIFRCHPFSKHDHYDPA